ncbi:hypothetical protein mRhiFer1_010016 [Rhinolophus ferrumequinum]|uniref:Uncharacterized protein n=1 Tax=Rhinolophus ferrumequinum TaxID=59479 RepID=A0A7J7Y566_RHIFE|nr:hypothetical protein mRhiFer1_010016 [Rhinolophus ferrumequinum]
MYSSYTFSNQVWTPALRRGNPLLSSFFLGYSPSSLWHSLKFSYVIQVLGPSNKLSAKLLPSTECRLVPGLLSGSLRWLPTQTTFRCKLVSRTAAVKLPWVSVCATHLELALQTNHGLLIMSELGTPRHQDDLGEPSRKSPAYCRLACFDAQQMKVAAAAATV